MDSAPFSWDLLHDRGTLFEPLGDHQITLIDPLDVAAAAAAVLTTDGHLGNAYTLTGGTADFTTSASTLEGGIDPPPTADG